MTRLRDRIKPWLPPVFLDTYRRAFRRDRSSLIWKGVYPKLSDVPAFGPSWLSEEYLGRTRRITQEVMAAASRGRQASGGKPEHIHISTLLAGMLSADPRRQIRVLDFGGGMGITWAHARGFLPDADRISYLLVENQAFCNAGRELFHDDDRIQFQDRLPEEPAQFDLVLVGSSLQYIDDYCGLLNRLGSYSAQFVVLTETPCGNIATFATGQYNVAGSCIPTWFIAQSELEQVMAGRGYRLVMQYRPDRAYDDCSDHPADLRLDRVAMLVFGAVE